MTRLAICTGWSFAPKSRALQPSMNRLANASSRSTRLYDLRAEQDDDRCDVDPGKKPCRERERPVRREQGKRSREVAERQFGDLPQHGRYQCALRRRSPRRPVARDDAVHDVEKDEAGEKARERREEPHADPHEPAETGADEDVGDRGGAEREAERNKSEHRQSGDESGRLEGSTNEAAPALPAENRGEGAIKRTMDRHRRENGADHADRERERAALHELARDPRFLRRRGWIHLAEELDEIALGAIRSVHEREDADEEREQRDERKEDLVRDSAGEERAIVGGEAHDHGPTACNSAG